ncbi:MAG: hypothetical protein RL136_2056 [Planctomycetota bacterium]
MFMPRPQPTRVADEFREPAGIVDARRHHAADGHRGREGRGENEEDPERAHACVIGGSDARVEGSRACACGLRAGARAARRSTWVHSRSMAIRLPSALIGPLVAAVLGSAAHAQSVEIELLHFGAGDLVRGGGPTAIQVQFRSSLDRIAEVEAVWEIPNADLDIAEYSRKVVLNPGQAQRRWLYGVLPPEGEGTILNSIFDLRLYELEGGERVRDLGTARLATSVATNPSRAVGLADDAILVIGARNLGLDAFGLVGSAATSATMNGTVVIANARDVDALPDRWEGFATFDSIVWADGSIAPSRMSEETARALREWTERGGNLVISLPAAGDPWSVGTDGRHPLSALLPSAAPKRTDGVPVADFLPLVSLSPTLRDPSVRTRLATFEPESLDRGWRPFLALPPGANGEDRIVGIRRHLGFGQVTLIGIDIEELSARGLQTPAIPQGDVFWNRILGRRCDTPSGAELAALEDESRLLKSGGFSVEIGEGRPLAETIGLSGQAAIGVLAATAVFGLYWLIAGPLGFALLKSMKRERWSWVVFTAVAAVFTGGIFLVGASMSGRRAQISHLTVIDAIERGPGESDLQTELRRRATSWMSVYVPSYGVTELALDPANEASARNLLTSWRANGSTVEGFPSRERYAVPVDRPARASVPSRATSVDLKARWLGAVRDGWGTMPRATNPIAVTIDEGSPSQPISISGTLVHGLPGTLRDVRVLHIWPKRNPLQTMGAAESDRIAVRRFSAQMPNRGEIRSVTPWAPGEPLDLAAVFDSPRPMTNRLGLEQSIRRDYIDDLEQRVKAGFGIVGDSVPLVDLFDMLSMYRMLPPPQYIRTAANANQSPFRVVRTGGRELDLSDWYAEPCLVVSGWLEQAELPFDFRLDGGEIDSSGRVLVRWIMPLPQGPEWLIPGSAVFERNE